MDCKKPYNENGKRYYKPYKNSFYTVSDYFAWNELEKQGYAKHSSDDNGFVDFHLTRKGLDWLGDILDCKIYNYQAGEQI